MIIKEDILKPLNKGKKIKLSWLTKLKNSEFTASVAIIYEVLEEALKDNKYLSDQPLNVLGELVDKITNLSPTQRPHNLTQTINMAHTKRKRQLTAIRQYIKTIIMSFDGFSSSQLKAAGRIERWLQEIYGTRHYDLGISKMTAKMSTMFLMLDEDSELMEAFELCSIPEALKELRESHELIISATLQRDIEMAERDLEPRFSDLRAEIYRYIRSLVQFIEARLLFNMEVDMMLNANYMLYNYINPKQANCKQQATKRRLARERAEANRVLSLQLYCY